jgi:ElaB/YqjD/DUF883 family membrane-anchored ribosome-binding protein
MPRHAGGARNFSGFFDIGMSGVTVFLSNTRADRRRMTMSAAQNKNQRALPTEQLREQASVIGQDVQELGSIARAAAQEGLREGRKRAQAVGKAVEDVIRDNPVRAVVIAAGVGFLASFLFGRRLI